MKFTYNIQVGNKVIKVKELSFTDVKVLCKSLMFKTDLEELKQVFNSLITDICIENGTQLNILEKIVVLLNIRGLTLGKDINLSYNGANVLFQTDSIIDAFNKQTNIIEYQHNYQII